MSIQQTIARIPSMTSQQRATLRSNAMDKLASGEDRWINDAKAIINALDDFESSEKRVRSAVETKRVAELEGASATERIARAFEFDPCSETEHKLLRVLLENPDSTCAELSSKIGWKPVAWDMAFGSMCSQRMEYLWPLDPAARKEKKGFIRFLTVERRDGRQEIRYTMKPEAVNALAKLGFS